MYVQIENEFLKVATIKIRGDCGSYEIKVDVLIDTGSPISFIKEKFIPNCLVKEQNNKTKFCGINDSYLNVVGTVMVDIKCDKVAEVGTNIYVVANNTMTASLIIGRDMPRSSKVILTGVEKDVEERDKIEIHNIDICEIVDSIDESLEINPEIKRHVKEILHASILPTEMIIFSYTENFLLV